MDYDTITYNEYILNIITTRGQWNIPDGEYWEGHHIVPKCLGGTGKERSKDKNIIWLYPNEHLIAHYLLWKENKSNIQLAHALRCMTTGVNQCINDIDKASKLYEDLRIAAHEVNISINKYLASITPKEVKVDRAKCGGQGNKKRLEDPQQNKEWRKTCSEVHKNRGQEKESLIYQKVSSSLVSYYETVDKDNDKDWIARQDKNKQTNIESSKKWRTEFKEIFGNTPESYRKYGLLKEVSQLFKDIRYKDKEQQQEAVNRLNSKIEEIV